LDEKAGPMGPAFLLRSKSTGFQFQILIRTGVKIREITDINLIKMFMVGPELSLNGSPTVSPMTAPTRNPPRASLAMMMYPSVTSVFPPWRSGNRPRKTKERSEQLSRWLTRRVCKILLIWRGSLLSVRSSWLHTFPEARSHALHSFGITWENFDLSIGTVFALSKLQSAGLKLLEGESRIDSSPPCATFASTSSFSHQ
jgi:hypothetical protein